MLVANTQSWISQSLFTGASAQLSHAGGSDSNLGVLDCRFVGVNNGFTKSTGKTLIYNCFFSGSSAPVTGIDVEVGGGSLWIYHSSCVAFARGVYIKASTTLSRVYNVSTLNCTTAGVDAIAATVARGLADYGSAVPYQSGVSPTVSISSAAFLSTVSADPNLTLASTSPGVFVVSDEIQADAGAQASLFNCVTPNFIFNGLTLEGEVNEEGGIASSMDASFNPSFCSFSGLGTYGVRLPYSSSVSYCLFNTNGVGIKLGQYGNTLYRNAGYGCGEAFIQQFSRASAFLNNSSSACAYGQYDSVDSSFVESDSEIYAQSGVYDYSGDDILTYSCVGTLDPTRTNAVDSFSLRDDPLFADPDGGDLTLQSLARDYFFDSPCIGVDSSAGDMGAFAFTYGTASTAWTLIDFASVSGSDPYTNPDGLPRSYDGIKLAEGDREDGILYSKAPTIKKGYTLTWNTSANPMPFQQLVDLINMFLSEDNAMQIDFGFGAGFENAHFSRNGGLQYDDLGGLYQDSTVPEPIHSINIRMD